MRLWVCLICRCDVYTQDNYHCTLWVLRLFLPRQILEAHEGQDFVCQNMVIPYGGLRAKGPSAARIFH